VAQREATLLHTFVEVADSLVSDFDVVDVLATLAERCVELFGASDAGLMLAAPGGELHVVASSSERMRDLELFEIQNEDGPCLDCYRSGVPISSDDLRDDMPRWPRFGPEALSAGLSSAYALPMRLREDVVGSLNLLRSDPGPMAAEDLLAAQALADVATIAILQQRAVHDARVLSEQLQFALNSRVVIEQAKGRLAGQAGTDVTIAFQMLRGYARKTNRKLADVAAQVVGGDLGATLAATWNEDQQPRP
jgi:GAF domain-containing protein